MLAVVLVVWLLRSLDGSEDFLNQPHLGRVAEGWVRHDLLEVAVEAGLSRCRGCERLGRGGTGCGAEGAVRCVERAAGLTVPLLFLEPLDLSALDLNLLLLVPLGGFVGVTLALA